jgi:hypothetical protein
VSISVVHTKGRQAYRLRPHADVFDQISECTSDNPDLYCACLLAPFRKAQEGPASVREGVRSMREGVRSMQVPPVFLHVDVCSLNACMEGG